MPSKKSFAALSILGLFLFGCRSVDVGPNVKIYVSQPEAGGMVRSQAQELIPYAQTTDWFALPPNDFEALLNWCKNPKSNANISYYIKYKLDEMQNAARSSTSSH